MVEVSLTVGKLDASLALLLTKDHHLIEFPTILLPNGVKAGSIVKIRCDRDLETEEKERKQFRQIQDEILATYGKNLPQNPVLRTKNVTQTSCVLAWDPLDLGTATLKSLVLYKDGKKLGAIPNPLNNNTTKLSGLSIDKTINLQLRLDSTAGIYSSETIEVTTHKMTDLSGINVCLGDISPNGQFSIDDIQHTLKNMGASYPASNKVQVETTHFIATRENKQNEEYIKANEMNIPVIRPEWLKACERERRIVGVRDFYVKDCVLPDIMSKDYWKDSKKTSQPSEPKETAEPAETKEAVEDDALETTVADESSAPVPEAEKLDDEPVQAEKLSPKVEADPAGADEVDLAGEQTEENTHETKETADSQIIEAETTELVPEKESSSEEQPEVEVQSTQAVVEPNDLADTEALDEETLKNESSLPDSKEFEKRDISLENVAEDETDTPDAVHSDTPEGATAGVTDLKENAGTIEAKQEKEKSPTSLEDVEI